MTDILTLITNLLGNMDFVFGGVAIGMGVYGMVRVKDNPLIWIVFSVLVNLLLFGSLGMISSNFLMILLIGVALAFTHFIRDSILSKFPTDFQLNLTLLTFFGMSSFLLGLYSTSQTFLSNYPNLSYPSCEIASQEGILSILGRLIGGVGCIVKIVSFMFSLTSINSTFFFMNLFIIIFVLNIIYLVVKILRGN